MLLNKIDKYISECDKYDKVLNSILTSGIELEDFLSMDENEREEIFEYLNEDIQKQIIKLQEGGLI
jgi:hypothetical protein